MYEGSADVSDIWKQQQKASEHLCLLSYLEDIQAGRRVSGADMETLKEKGNNGRVRTCTGFI